MTRTTSKLRTTTRTRTTKITTRTTTIFKALNFVTNSLHVPPGLN